MNENPQTENGHVDIANEIVEALARTRISGEEMQCLWVVFRKTYGWHKKDDHISISQFASMTGLSRPHVSRALKKLLSKKVLGVTKKGNSDVNSYCFIKHYSKWVLPKKVTDNGVAKKGITGVTNIGQRVLPILGNTKETITKETITKENKDMVLSTAVVKTQTKKTEEKPTDPLITVIIKYMLNARKIKTGLNYQFSGKHAGLLKHKLQCFTHSEVLAAFDVFIRDLMDDPDRFWRKGYSLDKFFEGTCFSICQEHTKYKERVIWHDLNTLGLKVINAESKHLCDDCISTKEECIYLREGTNKNIKVCPNKKTKKIAGFDSVSNVLGVLNAMQILPQRV